MSDKDKMAEQGEPVAWPFGGHIDKKAGEAVYADPHAEKGGDCPGLRLYAYVYEARWAGLSTKELCPRWKDLSVVEREKWGKLARQIASPPQDAQDAKADEFYLQDKRSFVGNDVLWWATAGGYTTDLSKAQVFSKEDAYKQNRMRDTDIPWPKSYIDGKTRPAVDMQYINLKAALRGKEGA